MFTKRTISVFGLLFVSLFTRVALACYIGLNLTSTSLKCSVADLSYLQMLGWTDFLIRYAKQLVFFIAVLESRYTVWAKSDSLVQMKVLLASKLGAAILSIVRHFA
jgi:hypothetical protein